MGLFEKMKGSGVCHISYCDRQGHRHRERIGRRSDAEAAYIDRIMAGVHLFAVKELLGHHSITMTEKYSHLSPGVRQIAVEKIRRD
jgi:integrase